MPRYSTRFCDRAASQAPGPGEMQTLRNKPSLCAFRNARNERAICFGVLCIGPLLNGGTNISCCWKPVSSLNARLIVRPNAQTRAKLNCLQIGQPHWARRRRRPNYDTAASRDNCSCLIASPRSSDQVFRSTRRKCAARFTVPLNVVRCFCRTGFVFNVIRNPLEVLMQAYNSQLADIEERLEDATQHLRVQQTLVPDIDCPRIHRKLLMLLANGLHVYCWLNEQRRRLTRS